jgi:predicted metal-binding membrane protein
VAGIVVVGTEPYARYLDHGKWTEIGLVGGVCRALPGGGETLGGALVVGGWVLMLAAMMLRNATIGDG